MRERNGSHSRSSCKRTRIATGTCLRDEYSKQNRRAHGMSRDAKRGRDARRPTLDDKYGPAELAFHRPTASQATELAARRQTRQPNDDPSRIGASPRRLRPQINGKIS